MCLAVPGQIETLDESAGAYARVGDVRFGGILKRVNLSLVPEAQVGSYVLVHVGVALQTLDEAEAQRVLDTLGQLSFSEPEK